MRDYSHAKAPNRPYVTDFRNDEKPLPSMKTKFTQPPAKLILLCLTCIALPFANSAFGQGTGFTYQGRLNVGTSPATGIFDLQFSIYDSAAGSNQIGGTIALLSTPV